MKCHPLLLVIPVCILFSISTRSQSILPPTWTSEEMFFIASKIKVLNTVNKPIFNGYKESYVQIHCIAGQPYSVTIDVPDRFYIKDAEIKSTEYKKTGEKISVVYGILNGDKLATIGITYDDRSLDTSPVSLIIVATDNFNKKVTTDIIISFSEFK